MCMIRLINIGWLCGLLCLLTACAEGGEALTLEANYLDASTQIADIRLTATVQAARARTTLDFIGTRSSLSATESVFLEETLVATGFLPDALATQREVVLGSTPTPMPSPTAAAEATQEANGLPINTPTAPPVTPLAPNATNTIAPTFDPNGLRVGSIVTATGAGDDGCGAGITSTFSTTTPEIYVITPAFNLSTTDTFSAHWTQEGLPIGPVYTFTPDFEVDELCVWFFVDPTDFPFIAGNYSVEIKVNDVSVAVPVPFVIQQQ